MGSAIPGGSDAIRSVLQEVEQAARVIPPYIRRTPLAFAPSLSKSLSAGATQVFLKLESEQVTGSFKARGAVNKLLSLTDDERRRGVVTASTGNHALAVAYALRTLPGAASIPARIYLPRTVAPVKLTTLREHGAPVHVVDVDDCIGSELAALADATATGSVYISPYNDRQVIGGQGTIGVEIHEQLVAEGIAAEAPTASTEGNPNAPLVVLVPVGGGGMIMGIATYLKSVRPGCIVIGTQPEENDCMIASVRAGAIAGEGAYKDLPTLSDGTAGGIEEGSITFGAFKGCTTSLDGIRELVRCARVGTLSACRPLVDGIIGVSEASIAAGVMYMLNKEHKLVEGSAGTSVGAVMEHGADLFPGCVVVAV